MNRKERRAEAKQNHNINNQQEETMNNNITTETDAQENSNINPNEENITMRQNTENQPGFFTRIKNAFINGYRETKTCIKEQVQEIKETYVSSLEENDNVILKHTKAVVKTAMHITVKTLKNLWAIIAWPFIKIDSIIDRKEEIEVTA